MEGFRDAKSSRLELELEVAGSSNSTPNLKLPFVPYFRASSSSARTAIAYPAIGVASEARSSVRMSE